MRWQKLVALALSLAPASVLTACGGSGSGGGNSQNPGQGTITLISFAPNPILGCDSVPFTITGTNFETSTGTTALITWRALGGQTPFANGTTDHVTTRATVTSDTTIDGLSPGALLCGVPSVTVELDVMLESGVSATSTGVFQVVINAPTIVSMNPNPLPAAINTPFIITGTGFPASGGPVTIRFTGDNGALLFNDGTHNYVDVQGLVTSTTQISATSPIATVCGVNAVTLAQLGASIQLYFPDGCCTLPTAPGFVNFLAPGILSLAPNSIPAELPPASLVLTGTNFGPPNTIATVRFVADAGVALFNDGTLNTVDVPGLIGPTTFPAAQTITLISPTADVCGVASRTATVRVISPYGSSCRQSAPAFVTFTAPVITTVNGLAQATVPASIPTAITIQGTGFGPANGVCAVTFVSDPAGPAIFGDGTQVESAPVQGVINAAGTQITVTTPHATVQGAANRLASVRISYQGGSCATSPAQFIQFTAATLSGIAATAPTAGTFFAAVPTSFTISGANFGPVGSEVFVRFVADNGATPFGNGTQNAFEVPGTVTAPGTITGVAPLAAVCPQTTLGATVRVLFQDGGQTSNTAAMIFTAPTISFAPATFPGSVATLFTITGTGFGPANSLVAVKFTATGGATPFGAGTLNEVTVTGTINGAGTQITGLTPLVAICGVPSITCTVSTTFQGGACASTTAGAVTVTAPTLTAGAFAPAAVPATIPTAFTITGTGFGTNGDLAQVTFSVTPPAAPFNHGTSSATTVTGTVGGGGTTITGFTPTVAACPADVLADVRVTLASGACSNLLAGAVTFLVPTIVSTNVPSTAWYQSQAYQITGTGFGPVGGVVSLLYTSSAGLPIYADGTSTTFVSVGTIVSATQINGTYPKVTHCVPTVGVVGGTPPSVTSTITVAFDSGACANSPAAFVTHRLPQLTVFATPVGGLIPATNPTAFAITGTDLGIAPSASPIDLVFSGGGFIYDPDGAGVGQADYKHVLGTINGGGTALIGVSPRAALIAANQAITIRGEYEDGTCTNTIAATLVAPPAITSVVNNAAPFNQAAVGTLQTDRFLSVIGTQMQINGTNFAAGATVAITNASTSAAIGTGTLGAPVTVTPATTITGVSPTDATLTGNTTVRVRVTNPDGQFADGTTLWTTSNVRPNFNASFDVGTNSENQIAVNPANPLNAVALAHQIATGGFVNMNASVTVDGGLTWTKVLIGNTQDGIVQTFRGDPMVAFDAFGNCYMNYISTGGGTDRVMLIQFAPSGGAVTAAVLGALAANVRTIQSNPAAGIAQDRNTLAVGGPAGTQTIACGHIDFTTALSDGRCAAFTSTGAGVLSAATGPVTVATGTATRFIQHFAPSVGPLGQVYISWIDEDNTNAAAAANVNFAGDLNGVTGGLVFGATTVVGTSDLGFRTFFTAQPNRGNGAVPMSVVINTGAKAGRIVITYTDEVPAVAAGGAAGAPIANNTVVVTQYSDTQGLTWSPKTYVRPATLDHHWLPWLGVDTANGNCYVTWKETADQPTKNQSVRFCAASTDGATWNAPLRISQGAATPFGAFGGAAGDYLEYEGIAVFGHRCYAVWADNANFTTTGATANPHGTTTSDAYVSVFQHKP